MKKSKLHYLVAIVILVLGFIIMFFNEYLGSLFIVPSFMFIIFCPLFEISFKKLQKEKIRQGKIKNIIKEKEEKGINANLICKKCGSNNTNMQVVNEKQSVGCLTIILYIILAISIVGWLILIPILLNNKSRTKTYGICQNCGNSWHIR